MKITKVVLLEKWCAEKGLFSKADLHKYGYENHYLRAWRTVCDFVTQEKAKHLTEQECKQRNLTTSMAYYEWIGEPPRTSLEESLADNFHKQEEQVYKNKKGQLSFII